MATTAMIEDEDFAWMAYTSHVPESEDDDDVVSTISNDKESVNWWDEPVEGEFMGRAASGETDSDDKWAVAIEDQESTYEVANRDVELPKEEGADAGVASYPKTVPAWECYSDAVWNPWSYKGMWQEGLWTAKGSDERLSIGEIEGERNKRGTYQEDDDDLAYHTSPLLLQPHNKPKLSPGMRKVKPITGAMRSQIPHNMAAMRPY